MRVYDALGQAILPGDWVAYGSRSGNTGEISARRVKKITEDGMVVCSHSAEVRWYGRKNDGTDKPKVQEIRGGKILPERLIVLQPTTAVVLEGLKCTTTE